MKKCFKRIGNDQVETINPPIPEGDDPHIEGKDEGINRQFNERKPSGIGLIKPF
jgi:hypothetical protein